MDFAKIISGLQEYGLTLTEISSHVGVSISALSDIKNGRTKEPTGAGAVRLYLLWSKPPAWLRRRIALQQTKPEVA